MSDKASDPPPHWLLRRADQAAVAVLVAVGLAATIGWWIAQGGPRGRLIEVDRAEPQTARFQVDVNQADWAELANLPGVGSTLAHRIVDCRRVGGPFARSRGPAAAGPRHRSQDSGNDAAVSASNAPQ